MLKVRRGPVASADMPATVDEALACLLAILPDPVAETVLLSRCAGRVLAETILSDVAQPPFDTAAMDGWAVKGETAGLYRVVGESRAGQRFEGELQRGEAALISTGAALPSGADRVVRREQARLHGALVELPDINPDRLDIRFRGEDFTIGRRLVEAGRKVDHLDLARLSAAGVTGASVTARPKVIIVPTGDEIIPAGAARSPDQIYDSISLPLEVRCREAGAIVDVSPVVRDDEVAARKAFAGMARDIVVVIGGASKGKHDLVRPALESFGLDIIISSVRMRPGKPFWTGRLGDGRLVIGLPGNPLAALVCAELFLLPVIRAWQGAAPKPPLMRIPCSTPIKAAPTFERFLLGRLSIDAGGQCVALPCGGDDSAALSPVAGADLLLRVRPRDHPGDRVEAIRLQV